MLVVNPAVVDGNVVVIVVVAAGEVVFSVKGGMVVVSKVVDADTDVCIGIGVGVGTGLGTGPGAGAGMLPHPSAFHVESSLQ